MIFFKGKSLPKIHLFILASLAYFGSSWGNTSFAAGQWINFSKITKVELEREFSTALVGRQINSQSVSGYDPTNNIILIVTGKVLAPADTQGNTTEVMVKIKFIATATQLNPALLWLNTCYKNALLAQSSTSLRLGLYGDDSWKENNMYTFPYSIFPAPITPVPPPIQPKCAICSDGTGGPANCE